MADSKKIDDGGSAFPIPSGTFGLNGMSLRDWFAGQAMHFVLESRTIDDVKQCAEMSYMVADAMIIARKAGA